jgi:predicted ArsR family transcriptional regulator
VRRSLFTALTELGRPATTQELAERVSRHPNTVRVQLERLASAGLLERRTTKQVRGRPRHEWAVSAAARPGGAAPQAHGQLAAWLARALSRPPGLDQLEDLGREIGGELAAGATSGRPLAEAMQDALAALGFAPAIERPTAGAVRFVLRSCPYRDAVRENQPAVCTLHRGVSRGLLERLAPGARLTGFVPKDPDAAGCLIDVAAGGDPQAAGRA